MNFMAIELCICAYFYLSAWGNYTSTSNYSARTMTTIAEGQLRALILCKIRDKMFMFVQQFVHGKN